jgi:sigma-B regulation protein RsbU (phosphoserine phosphatase)
MDAEAPTPHPDRTMRCMEVWGGNAAADNGVVMPGLDVWVHCRPHGGAAGGGDVHYVSSCATGRITRLLVADVSGHGEGAAEVARALRGLMRRFVNYVDQDRFVSAMNREFAARAEEGRFATAVVATCWGPTGEVELSCAGHPPPVLYRARERAWSRADAAAGSIPLGINDAERFGHVRLALRRGDVLVLYTDSVIESRNPAGRMLGIDGLLDLVRRLETGSVQSLAEGLVAALDRILGSAPPQDDVTIVVARPNDLRYRRTLGDWASTARVAAGMLAESLRPGGTRFPWPQLRLDNIAGAFFHRFNGRRSGE